MHNQGTSAGSLSANLQENTRKIIDLYDEYTHAPLDRRVLLARLAEMTGSTVAALAMESTLGSAPQSCSTRLYSRVPRNMTPFAVG